jgi:threonylcarbamoyladenosine tRNA methylthiotransferase MtaB
MEQLTQKEKFCLLSLHSSCENSSYNLSKIETFLTFNHYTIVGEIEFADVIIINSCVYSDQMQLSNENRIQEILASHPDKKVLVFGCLVNLTSMQEQSNLLLVGNLETDKLSKIFQHSVPFETCHTNRLTHFSNYQDKITQEDNYVQICQGCCNSCRYCNIKLAKGTVRSTSIESIRDEVRRLTRKNVFEIVLLADDCGSYGHDLGSNIVDLLSDLTRVDGRLVFKIYTIFPDLFLKYYSGLKPFIEDRKISYICAPLQSASGRILKLMNRAYDVAAITDTLKEIKSISPDTYLFTHFMLNFPSETIQDFQKSLTCARLFDSSMFIPYQENQKTPAYGFEPKCTREALLEKMEMLKQHIDNGNINAVLVGS